MTESRVVADESLSTDKFLGGENVGLEHPEEFVLNDDSVGDIDVDDSDDSEPIVRFIRMKSTMRLVKPPRPRHIKTTTSPTVPLNVPSP